MQYVRSISGSVSKTWNSINPATLSGAIDVIVVEQEDGSLACSPFHVRFGKFSLLRPYEKKVEFRVNNEKQDYAMKLGEGGEAFFVFETSDNIPEAMQTSPLVSPASSPPLAPLEEKSSLGEPEFLDLATASETSKAGADRSEQQRLRTLSSLTPLSSSPTFSTSRPTLGDWADLRGYSEAIIPTSASLDVERDRQTRSLTPTLQGQDETINHSRDRSKSPPPLPTKEAIERAVVLSEKLSASNIPSEVNDTGDLTLDMTGFKSSEDDALRAEIIARKILSEELRGNYDIGALIGADEQGRLWIYSSEEAKEAAAKRASIVGMTNPSLHPTDASSDPGYHSDVESEDLRTPLIPTHHRTRSDASGFGLQTPPKTPPETAGDPNRNYAKTLRLTSDQLKALRLKSGPNAMSFTVNRATCHAFMYLWRYDVPLIISDIDGTITKSDALGQVLNMIGRDWTHLGVAKLYTEIHNNGYNITYLTSRSVGQADTTRAYLNGVVQEGYRLPKGPTIMSPDRTIAALRRELYIRKPEVFKMACLRDIKNLFDPTRTPFYAGFGNRFTDALSYRSVSIPQNRIFTINSYAEVSLDLLSLNKLRYSYVNMREVVDHYFPPVNTLIKRGGEDYTDFTYWREPVLDIDQFSDSDESEAGDSGNISEEEEDEELGDSYVSRGSIDEGYDDNALSESILSASIDGDEHMTSSILEANEAKEYEEGEEEEGQEERQEDDEDDAVTPDTATPGPRLETEKSIPPASPGGRKDSAQQDLDAEVITGMQGLSMVGDYSEG